MVLAEAGIWGGTSQDALVLRVLSFNIFWYLVEGPGNWRFVYTIWLMFVHEYLWHELHFVSKIRPPFSYDCSFYKWWPIFTIFGTQYTELMCNITVISLPTSSAYCCYSTLGNIECSSEGLTGQDYAFIHSWTCCVLDCWPSVLSLRVSLSTCLISQRSVAG